MDVFSIIQSKSIEFQKLCEQHKVVKLFAFGSSITNHFDPEKSDIDLLVSVNIENPIEKGEMLLSLWDKFELFFNRKVDLLTDNSIRNPILRSNIYRTKMLVYDGEGVFEKNL